MTHSVSTLDRADPLDPNLEAAKIFTRRRLGAWSDADESLLQERLAQDEALQRAFDAVERAWDVLGRHAASPQLAEFRGQTRARTHFAPVLRTTRQMWQVAAAVIALTVALTFAFRLSPYAHTQDLFQTRLGEQRLVELDDHSRIALDSNTRVRVRLLRDERLVDLVEGQAQFFVAKDPARPFKVRAGDHTVVAIGTAFTIEYVEGEFHVAMLEGKVAVLSDSEPPRRVGEGGIIGAALIEPAPRARAAVPHPDKRSEASDKYSRPAMVPVGDGIIELTAGEGLRVAEDGSTILIPRADLEAANAWRQGKVIFRDEPLLEAVRRLNRYSRAQLQIDDRELASLRVSGVFEAGDSRAFAEAVEAYLPVVVEYSDKTTLRLRAK
jgi:transmembrane sensor